MTDRDKIIDLVAEELDEANKKYPLFHSPHEAYAVLLEEADEMIYEANYTREEADYMWDMVRTDRSIEPHTDRIYRHAISVAQEAIQVAAMCEKIKQSGLY